MISTLKNCTNFLLIKTTGHTTGLQSNYQGGTWRITLPKEEIKNFFKAPIPPGFYWGHQCSWTLTPANSMQVSIIQFDNCNRKYPSPKRGLILPHPRSLGWMGEQINRSRTSSSQTGSSS